MKVTIADIARMAGVSKATVSRVINNKPDGVGSEVREKILELIDTLGYQPNRVARSLATAQSRELVLILPDITNPFFSVLLRGVEDFAKTKDYTVFLCNTDGDIENEQQQLLGFFGKRVAGVILVSNAEGYPRLGRIQSSRPPIVLLDRKAKALDCALLIQTDNESGGRMAARHLLELGRKKIAYLTGPRESEVVKERLKGYRKALAECGVPLRSELVHYGCFSLESGEQLAKELLAGGEAFDSVCCGCDLIAMGAMHTLVQSGLRVPQDVAVMGFDNTALGRVFEPSLSTVDQHPYEMGALAAEKLIELIGGEPITNDHILLRSDLVVRKSTKGEG